MHIGEYHPGVILERIEHAISMVRIDVHVRDPLQPRIPTQQLDRDSAIVENAKACSVIAPGVMQAGYRHKRMAALSAHDGGRCIRRCANDSGRSFVNTTRCRRVAGIEETLPPDRPFPDVVPVISRME